MKKLLSILIVLIPVFSGAQQSLSLEESYSLAEKNYPLTRQIDLLQQKVESEINAIEKEKFPLVNLNLQSTYQSEVIEFPLQIPNSTVKPPNKDQYRATLDLNQLIYNGGIIDANIKLKSAELLTQQQQVTVSLYALKSRINLVYFNILLLQEQWALLRSKHEQLQSRLDEVEVGVKYGAVLPTSGHVLEAEMLTVQQLLSQIEYDRKKSLDNLSALLLKEIDSTTVLIKPKIYPSFETPSARPEFKLFELQQNQIEISKEVITKAKYPKVLGFAQAGYGNPGLNMLDNSFQDFYMVGVKLNWNVFDWGKTKEKKQALKVTQEIINSEKETFQLNQEMQLQELKNEMYKLEALISKDDKIIASLEKVVNATNSQLKNGVITSSQYLIEFNKLFEAKINQKLHELQLELAKANYRIIKGISD